MKCPYSTTQTYINAVGVKCVYTRPCGHCYACLHNRQDELCVRALETCKEYPQFVYDTLTFAPRSLPLVPLDEQIQRREFEDESLTINLSDNSLRVLRQYSTNGDMVPAVDRDIIRNWLKRARIAFTRCYGHNPVWKYLIFMEYGPKYSRPHFHLIFWNISKKDYDRFLGTPWRRDYGFTKPAYFNFNSSDKDRNCITRYISKYISKGNFESPLVKDGLLPKPFKFYSQGLGLGYILQPKFDYFRSHTAEFLKRICVTDDEPGTIDRTKPVVDYVLSYNPLLDFSANESELKKLSVYYDDAGYPHRLPRYYKQKLLNLLKPNVFSYAIQTNLLARAELLANKALQKFAFALGYTRANFARPFLGLGRRVFDLLSVKYSLAERLSSFVKAQRRKIELTNHYSRVARFTGSQVFGIQPQFVALIS